MNLLRLRRHDRRQRDPFLSTPVVRDAAGIRPATAGEIAGMQPPRQGRFADPHGIATDETLGSLRAQAEADSEAWWGLTEMDIPPAMARPYADLPFGAGRLSPAHVPLREDLDGLPLFRDTVRSVCVRAEPHHVTGRDEDGKPLPCGQPPQGDTWQEQHAAAYRHRTAPIPWPRLAFAGDLRALHAEMATGADQAERAYAAWYLAGVTA